MTVNSKTKALVLVSAPEHNLDRARRMVQRVGGHCAAGTSDDQFHSDILDRRRRCFGCIRGEGWRPAWKGKVFQTTQVLEDLNPGVTLIAIALHGGRQCQWEQHQLLPGGRMRTQMPNVRMKVCADLEELQDYLDRDCPAEEAV